MTDTHELLNAERTAFWTALAAEAPDLGIAPSAGWEKEILLASEPALKFKISLSQDETSVYLFSRSEAGQRWIEENAAALAGHLRTTSGSATGQATAGRWFRKDKAKACVTVRRQWPEAIRWIRAQHATFSRAIAQTGQTE